jgi:hypothetical protein
MIHATNTVTYNLANDVKYFNKEMASYSLEWHVMLSPNKMTGVVFWPAGLWKSMDSILVVLRPKLETLSTAFFF